MKFVIYSVTIVSLICLAFTIGYSIWRVIQLPTKRWRESAFDYVFVDDNGDVRELEKEEEERLNSLLFVGDEEEFFVKSRYKSLNPAGRLSGYLRRRQLPGRCASARGSRR